MVLSDNSKNTEFLYLYVDEFQWLSHMDTEAFSGHPKPKSVYRAIFNKDTRGYRIIYGTTNGNPQAIVLKNLANKNKGVGYLSNMVILTRDNILNFDISDEDLDKMVFWIDTENKDLDDIMKKSKHPTVLGDNLDNTNLPPLTPMDIIPLITNNTRRVDGELSDFLSLAQNFQDKDPFLFDAIHDLMNYISDDRVNDVSFLNFSKNFASGANVSAAFQALTRYAGDNRRTNLDEQDLLQAIKHLLNEYTQRRING